MIRSCWFFVAALVYSVVQAGRVIGEYRRAVSQIKQIRLSPEQLARMDEPVPAEKLRQFSTGLTPRHFSVMASRFPIAICRPCRPAPGIEV